MIGRILAFISFIPACYAYVCYVIWKGDFVDGIKVISTLKYS